MAEHSCRAGAASRQAVNENLRIAAWVSLFEFFTKSQLIDAPLSNDVRSTIGILSPSMSQHGSGSRDFLQLSETATDFIHI